MGSGGKTRWKISSLYHRSPATTPRSIPPPREFVCPISGRLMADPVILPSGHTFERGCVQACKDHGVAPPGATDPSDFLLIPNMALKAAIDNWCDSLGLERPQPLDPATALHLVHGLSAAPPSSSAVASPPSSSGSTSIGTTTGEEEAAVEKSNKSPTSHSLQTCTSPSSSSTATASSYFTTTTTVATSNFSSSSSSSDEIIFSCDSQCPPSKSPAFSTGLSPLALEEEILARLGDPQISEQEAALLLLRSATRDGGGYTRAALCTPRVLAALRPALLSRYPSLQSHAAAALLNLSLHPPNRARVVRAGAVPALVDVLKGGSPDAQDHAAGALFSLAVDDDNKAAVGALGALPPLLHLLSRPSGGDRARRDATMALYHLSMAGTNRSKLVKLGAVRTLLGIATRPPQEAPTTLPALALMVLCNLGASGEGREAMMEAGAVEALVGQLRAPPAPGSRDPASESRREHCVEVLYWMSRGSKRFRGLARAAGAEEVLRAVVEQEAAAAEDGKRWRTREMAKRALHAAGVADVGSGGGRGGIGDEAAVGGVSEPALRARRRPVNVSGANSTKF